jgi:hypothetical protein
MLLQIWLDRAVRSLPKFEETFINGRPLTMQNSGLEDIFLRVQSQEKWFVCSCRVTGVMGLKRRPKYKHTLALWQVRNMNILM